MTNSILPNGVNFSKAQKFGAAVEQWTLDQLTAQGYEARPLADWNARADLLVSGSPPVLVEVKGARPTWRRVRPGYYRPRWQFCIGERPNYDHVVLLVAEDHRGDRFPFIVPSWLLWERPHVAITSHPARYAGMFARYLDRWGVIDQVMARRRCYSFQLPLLALMG